MAMNVQLLPEWDLRDYPLSFECINDLALILDCVNPLGHDWRGLAVNLGFDESGIIQLLESKKTSQTRCVIEMYVTMKEWPTWYGIQFALKIMERADAEHELLKHAAKLRVPRDAASAGQPSGWGDPTNLSQNLRDRKLHFSCLEKISGLLNSEHPRGLDWKVLACKLGFKGTEIARFERNHNPAMSLLQEYQMKQASTFADIYRALQLMPRYDVIHLLWNLNKFNTENPSTVTAGITTSQSLPYIPMNKDTDGPVRMDKQPKRQMSEQDRSSERMEIDNLVDMFGGLGIDDQQIRDAIQKAFRQGVRDPDEICDRFIFDPNDNEADTESTDSDEEVQHTESMGPGGSFNITGRYVQIGSNNTINTGAKPRKKKKVPTATLR